jgi:hypothetical protein
VKLRSWPEIGSDGDVSAPYVPKGMTGDDDDNECTTLVLHFFEIVLLIHWFLHKITTP